MVRRRFHPILAFAAVIAAAGSVTAAGLTFTAHTVQKSVAELPQLKPRELPSYVVRLPTAKPADLDISKVVAAKPKVPVAVPQVPVAQAAVAVPSPTVAAEQQPTLVAEVTPLAEEPATEVVNQNLYRVNSDVFVRSGPGKDYGRVGTVKGGVKVTVTDEKSGWMKVSFKGGSGWVYQRYLARTGGERVAEAETGAAPF